MTEPERLRWQLDVSWSLLSLHLKQVTDEEALWEPAANCWSVRRQPDGTWAADWAVPEPEPIPALSVGWVMWHIGFWWTHAHTQCFGRPDAALDWSRAAALTPWPGDVASAIAWLTDCHDRWTTALTSLTEADLDSTERTGWFADGSLSLGHVLGWANLELMKNAAEIGTLRHLRNADRA
ncbi:DinB family protein [Nonomuraea aridisoli]|uniref:Damage-inducible protein DinB n=1 Tax=Nonomuraea aridisoli TaxID=2070368 RepID=A0A2W2F808_9ACTN|nr:DinB family protein [Nonomuraea aridisoli]PZG21198.1 damage-inducible protein DinB [Nonomuraea aridisoli]